MTIKPVSYAEILDSPEAEGLLAEYSAECSIPEIGPTCPQRQIYTAMEATGMMHSFGAFEGSKLIGFATILAFVLPHYGKKVATVESLFVAKAHRNGRIGLMLMDEIETIAKRMECSVILYNARAGSRLERFLGALSKYQRTNSVFLKAL